MCPDQFHFSDTIRFMTPTIFVFCATLSFFSDDFLNVAPAAQPSPILRFTSAICLSRSNSVCDKDERSCRCYNDIYEELVEFASRFIGRQFSSFVMFPFLRINVVIALTHTFGIFSSSKHVLNKEVIAFNRISISIFYNFNCIPVFLVIRRFGFWHSSTIQGKTFTLQLVLFVLCRLAQWQNGYASQISFS